MLENEVIIESRGRVVTLPHNKLRGLPTETLVPAAWIDGSG
jgi:hypothetical protein